MAKSKASVDSLPEGSTFEISIPLSPPLFPKPWKGIGVVTAQKEGGTEVLLNSGRYLFLKPRTSVQVVSLGNNKKHLDKAKLRKLKNRFSVEGKPLSTFKTGDKVLAWRPALEQYAAYKIYRVSKRSVTLADEEGHVDVVSGHHNALPLFLVKDTELP